MGHLSALFKVALCLQDNVAKGSGADTTGNLPVSEEEAVPVAEAVGCHRCGVPGEHFPALVVGVVSSDLGPPGRGKDRRLCVFIPVEFFHESIGNEGNPVAEGLQLGGRTTVDMRKQLIKASLCQSIFYGNNGSHA